MNTVFIEAPFLACRLYGRIVYHAPTSFMMIKNIVELMPLPEEDEDETYDRMELKLMGSDEGSSSED